MSERWEVPFLPGNGLCYALCGKARPSLLGRPSHKTPPCSSGRGLSASPLPPSFRGEGKKKDTDTAGLKTLNPRTRFHLLPTKPFPLVSFHPISNAHLAVTVSIWNGGLAPLLELNYLMIHMWTHQESNPDLTVIIKACSSISGKAGKTGGK